MHYQEKLDKIFSKGGLRKHRTLRTVFDPYSSEWDDTTINKKIEILKLINENEIDLMELIDEYKLFYLDENKPHVIKSVEEGLKILLSKAIE
jgi:hypothetical protein